MTGRHGTGLADASGDAHGRYPRYGFGHGPLSLPEVACLLHRQPDARAVAAQLADPNRHLGRHGNRFGNQPMQRLARHAERLSDGGHAQAERRQNVLTQDRTGMRRLAGRVAANVNHNDAMCNSSSYTRQLVIYSFSRFA
jgi:hypothetical protein